MRIFGGALRNVTVSTTATAQYLGGRGCIYALTGGGGLNVTGNVDVPNCNVISNQNITGGGSITAASIGAHGRSSVAATPAAITGILQASDPLSYLPAQGTGGGCITEIRPSGEQQPPAPVTLYSRTCIEAPTRLEPSRPQSGVFAGMSSSTPGTYVITDWNGIRRSTFEGSGTVSGNGVTFYVAAELCILTNANDSTEGFNKRPVRRCPDFQSAGNNNAATINGADGSYVQGALYFPNATLT